MRFSSSTQTSSVSSCAWAVLQTPRRIAGYGETSENAGPVFFFVIVFVVDGEKENPSTAPLPIPSIILLLRDKPVCPQREEEVPVQPVEDSAAISRCVGQ